MSKGIKTSFWGPAAWVFLFSSIAGAYPVRVDFTDRAHIKVIKSFQSIIKSLENTLPCSYCRNSYRTFLKELPLSKYEHSRREMMRWMYLLRDRVNQKLIEQEQECYQTEKKKLVSKNLRPERLAEEMKKLRAATLLTKPSPLFEKVVAMYEKQRAGCTKSTMRCS